MGWTVWRERRYLLTLSFWKEWFRVYKDTCNPLQFPSISKEPVGMFLNKRINMSHMLRNMTVYTEQKNPGWWSGSYKDTEVTERSVGS